MSKIMDIKDFKDALHWLMAAAEDGGPTEEAERLKVVVGAYSALHGRLSASAIEAWLTRDFPEDDFPHDPEVRDYVLFTGVEPTCVQVGLKPDKFEWANYDAGGEHVTLHESAIPADLRLDPGGGPVRVRLLILAGENRK